MKKKSSNKGTARPLTRRVIVKPSSKRQVRRHLKNPLAKTSAVIYFTDKDNRPFMLSPGGGGISAGGEFKLTKKWKLTKETLDRIFIIASEEDLTRTLQETGEDDD